MLLEIAFVEHLPVSDVVEFEDDQLTIPPHLAQFVP